MATLADSLVSSSARRLAMRMRPDLSARQHRYQGRVYWVVKEPVGLNYFRFQEEEFAILRWLDGQCSLDELKEKFEEEFPPQKIGVEELQQFIGMLHKSGLIIANAPGQGKQLKIRRDERKRKELLSKFTNLLSIRFKGIDPDRLLTWMAPKMRWFYTRPAVLFFLTYFAVSLGLVLVNYTTFRARLPDFHDFFTLKNAFWLSIALGVTKVLHEFGHGLTCKNFGGECHEMGVMILVLTPCLYCNVSDSWMLPNKWHRAAIGAGGMYVELIIASTCTWIWWYTDPSTTLNNLCLSTMFVCSVSTLVFNSNPLLRYDGYYILSDLIEIPNLRQKATDILNRKLGYWCLGFERPDDPFLPERNQLLFALYSVAAAIYRWIVVFSILWFLYQIWKPYRLEIIGQIIGLVAIYGLFVHPLWKLAKFFYVPGRVEKVKKPRLFATLGVLAALLAAVAFVPLPYRVYGALEIQPRDPVNVCVVAPGRLDRLHIKPGQTIAEGDAVADLSNLDLDFHLAQLEGERDELQAKLKGLELLRRHDPLHADSIPAIEKEIASNNERLAKVVDRLEQLKIKAPVAGVVLPPAEKITKPAPNGELPDWSGSPFDRENAGAYLTEDVVLCRVGDPTRMEAQVVIDQDDIEFIEEGQEIDIQLNELPGETLRSKVASKSETELNQSPEKLSAKAGGDLPTKTDPTGAEVPLNTSYQVSAPLDDPNRLMHVGLRGQAKIHAKWQTLGQRGLRLFFRAFDFKL